VNATLPLAVGMVRSWVALYTFGLPRDLRVGRRMEIDCDLWEQRQLAEYGREPPLGTAAEIAARALLGVISDITWRVQAGLSARSDRSIGMNESLLMRGLLLLGLAPAVFLVVVGAQVIGGATDDGETGLKEIAYALGLFAAAAGIAVGLIVSQRTPRLGIGLVLVGTIAASVMMFWVAVFTVPIGIVLATIAYFRGRRGIGWPRAPGTA